MFKLYVYSVIFFIISVFLFVFRCIVLKDKINLKSSSSTKIETLYILLRIILAGMLPLINIVLTLVYLYYGILVPDDDFIKFCSSNTK